MDVQLLKQPLLQYGQELLTALKEEQGIDSVGCVLQSISRNELSAKQKELKEPILQDPVQKKKLFRFIAKKTDVLYKQWETGSQLMITDAENEELCAVLPPLESFMNVPSNDRKKHFFECLEKGDIVIGTITGRQENGFIITLLCMDGGVKREIHDLGIKAFCPLTQVPALSHHENPFDTYQIKDLVRGVVLSTTTETERIILSMKSDTLAAELQHILKVGLITEEDIPSHHRRLTETSGQSYQEVLEKTRGFNNPATATHMCSSLGIQSWKQSSLMKGLHMIEFPKEEYAETLRKAQSAKWAYKSLKDGVMHFKAGNHTEAFQCLNKALQIDPENVEALVARGALFANNNNLRRALEDFEAALQLDPDHPNAGKYMSETLVALGKYYEEKGDLEAAMKTYKKAVKVNLNNSDAKDALTAAEVKGEKRDSEPRLFSSQGSLDLPAEVVKSANTREKLRLLLKEEVEKKKHKKRRHRSSSSSSSSSSTSSSSRSSSSSEQSVKIEELKKSKDKKRKKHEKSKSRNGDKHKSSKKKHKKDRSKKKKHSEPSLSELLKLKEESSKTLEKPAKDRLSLDDRLKKFYERMKAKEAKESKKEILTPPAKVLPSLYSSGNESDSPLKMASVFSKKEEHAALSSSYQKSPKPSASKKNEETTGAKNHVPSSHDKKSSSSTVERDEHKSTSYDKESGFQKVNSEKKTDKKDEISTEHSEDKKPFEFKWKNVKKFESRFSDSHEEGSIPSEEEKRPQEKKTDQPSAAKKSGKSPKKAESSHEEGSIHSDSDSSHKKKDKSGSSSKSKHKRSKKSSIGSSDSDSSSGSDLKKSNKTPLKYRRKFRKSRRDSSDYSSSDKSARLRSPNVKDSKRRYSDDYSSSRSASPRSKRGEKRKGSRDSYSSDRDSDKSPHRKRYSSDDSRDGSLKKGRRRDDSFSSGSSEGSRRRSPNRRTYRKYYNNYNNRRYYNYGNYNNRGYYNNRGWQNYRGRGGRRPYRPFYNRQSPRYYNNYQQHRRDNRDGRDNRDNRDYRDQKEHHSNAETQDNSKYGFCPPWKRRNPIVSRAPDAEELRRLKEAAAQRTLEKDNDTGPKITKAAIIKNWIEDDDDTSVKNKRRSRSRSSSTSSRSKSRSRSRSRSSSSSRSPSPRKRSSPKPPLPDDDNLPPMPPEEIPLDKVQLPPDEPTWILQGAT